MEKSEFSKDLVRPSKAIRSVEKIAEMQEKQEAINSLSSVLQNEIDVIARSLAVETLSKYDDEEKVSQILSEVLQDHSAGTLVRCSASRALGVVGGKIARKALEESLKSNDTHPLVLATSIKSLGVLKDPQVTNSLSDIFSTLDDPRCPPYLLRTYAAEALGEIGSNDGIPILEKIKQSDSHSSVREAATKALDQITEKNR